jgi:hypothetical protein
MDFGKGVALGISISMTLVIGLMAFELRGMGQIYSDIGPMKLPLLTQLTLATAWLVGVPLGGAAACLGLFLSRPRSPVPYIALAVGLVVAAVLTYYGPRLPIFQLAGNIKAD